MRLYGSIYMKFVLLLNDLSPPCCMFVCLYVYMFTCLHVYMFTSLHVYMFVSLYLFYVSITLSADVEGTQFQLH